MRSLFRIRFIAYLMCAVLLMSTCTGCGGIEVVRPDEPGREIEPIPHVQDDSPAHTSPVGQAEFPNAYSDSTPEEDEYEVENEEVSGGIGGLTFFSEDNLAGAYTANSGKYAYSQLDEGLHKVYCQIYLALITMSSNVGLDCDDADTIHWVFDCVMMDHPEIFWVSGYVSTRYTRGETMEAMGFRGSYTMDAGTVAQRQSSIGNYVSACLYEMPAGDDYVKLKYIYEYIILNTDYDKSAVDNQNICSVFINGRSVCVGYAKAVQYLCDRAGIMCTLITGTTNMDGKHAWNLVQSDGDYYYLDATWGDANYRSESGDETSIPAISYDYLCVPGYELFRTHEPSSPVALPDCSAIADNYYVREGAYFTYPDEDGLRRLFDSAYDAGSEFVTVKASDETAYVTLRSYLLDDQNVFRLMGDHKRSSTISFWENTDSYTINFRLI